MPKINNWPVSVRSENVSLESITSVEIILSCQIMSSHKSIFAILNLCQEVIMHQVSLLPMSVQPHFQDTKWLVCTIWSHLCCIHGCVFQPSQIITLVCINVSILLLAWDALQQLRSHFLRRRFLLHHAGYLQDQVNTANGTQAPLRNPYWSLTELWLCLDAPPWHLKEHPRPQAKGCFFSNWFTYVCWIYICMLSFSPIFLTLLISL